MGPIEPPCYRLSNCMLTGNVTCNFRDSGDAI